MKRLEIIHGCIGRRTFDFFALVFCEAIGPGSIEHPFIGVGIAPFSGFALFFSPIPKIERGIVIFNGRIIKVLQNFILIENLEFCFRIIELFFITLVLLFFNFRLKFSNLFVE